ncbi:hypothetical protein E6W17_41800 [Streptomyces sp. A1547]|nr:hypothetical protein E6W17_41800 [Streptomyces sp. A1547]
MWSQLATLGHRRDIDLRSTDLRHADLSNGNLANAQLSDSDLRNTYLYNANLKTPPEPCRPTGRQSSQFGSSGASTFLAAASGGQGPDPREFAETEVSSAGTRGSVRNSHCRWLTHGFVANSRDRLRGRLGGAA